MGVPEKLLLLDRLLPTDLRCGLGIEGCGMLEAELKGFTAGEVLGLGVHGMGGVSVLVRAEGVKGELESDFGVSLE
jgi:hypothetical protein